MNPESIQVVIQWAGMAVGLLLMVGVIAGLILRATRRNTRPRSDGGTALDVREE